MKIITVITFFGVLVACGPKRVEQPAIGVEKYKAEIEDWHEKRVENLKSPGGWLNVVGLFWLDEGINTFGSSEKNDIVFPRNKIPERAGMFLLKQSTVTLEPAPDVSITIKKVSVGSSVVFHPDSAKAAVQEYGSLQWHIIKRDNKFGVRLRDFSSPAIQSFTQIDRYPVDPAWRIEASFEEARDSTRTISITNVLGQTTAQPSPGTLVFFIDDKEYRLDVLDEGGKDYFVIVGDATNTHETYGAGRYMYVSRPDSNGKVIVDFNKIYNPPCAFTAFATCPLPPGQNVLDVAITAGEKNYELGHQPENEKQ